MHLLHVQITAKKTEHGDPETGFTKSVEYGPPMMNLSTPATIVPPACCAVCVNGVWFKSVAADEQDALTREWQEITGP